MFTCSFVNEGYLVLLPELKYLITDFSHCLEITFFPGELEELELKGRWLQVVNLDSLTQAHAGVGRGITVMEGGGGSHACVGSCAFFHLWTGQLLPQSSPRRLCAQEGYLACCVRACSLPL